ncbi:hypothetical protein [Isoptericola sp. BMS4]|uniref:hypothetical protein n=1 Tax=Isoptericola sp. BMS4 TaxID=2527875 RepID=UPI001424426A|nr:hypothetical protein [Isoptericola sp. BMS4]
MTDETSNPERDAIPVAALPEVGSERLAAALEAKDVPAIGQALRLDVVVVPILRPSGGETQNRVFEAPEGSARPYEVCLFSSAQTLAAFLTPDAPDREFALRRGTSLMPFLEQHAEVIERVVFDPAGPHPMAATPEDVLLALVPQPEDDDVAWVTGGLPAADAAAAAADGDDDTERAVVPLPELEPDDADAIDRAKALGFDLNLPRQWAVIELDDAERRRQQVRRLVKRQTSVLGDRGSRLRRDMREWLERAGVVGRRAAVGVPPAAHRRRRDRAEPGALLARPRAGGRRAGARGAYRRPDPAHAGGARHARRVRDARRPVRPPRAPRARCGRRGR